MVDTPDQTPKPCFLTKDGHAPVQKVPVRTVHFSFAVCEVVVADSVQTAVSERLRLRIGKCVPMAAKWSLKSVKNYAEVDTKINEKVSNKVSKIITKRSQQLLNIKPEVYLNVKWCFCKKCCFPL